MAEAPIFDVRPGDTGFDLTEEVLEGWQEDGYESRDAWVNDVLDYVKAMKRSSEKHFLSVKERWARVYKRLELEDILTQNAILDPIYAQLPRMAPVVEELAAMLVENQPRPAVEPEGDDDVDDGISMMNSIINKICDANNYEYLQNEQAIDGILTNVGCVKTTIDRSLPPLYTEFDDDAGSIVFDKIDPRYIWPDPFCKRMSPNPSDWRFLIVGEPRDCAEIDLLFPEHQGKVKPEPTYSDLAYNKDERSGPALKMNRGSDEPLGAPSRGRAVLLEVWINDLRTKFIPMVDDETGEVLFNSDGEPRGKWVRRYPAGRVIYIANGVVLRDIPNPFDHGHIPYVFYPVRISKKALTWGIGEALLLCENKLGKLDKDAFSCLLYNMSAPWIADITAFVERDDMDSLSNAPDQIIVKNQGTDIHRALPGELPNSFEPVREAQETIFDANSGIPGILRGQVAKGSQQSADAIQQLQGVGSSRVRLRNRLQEWGVKEHAYQLQHLIPQCYPKAVQIKINGKDVQYDPKKFKDKYRWGCEAGSSLPGAKQSTQEMAFRLFELNAIDRLELLTILKWPHKMQVLNRMKLWDMLALAETGKSRDGNPGNKTGQAGAKTKYGGG